MAKLPKYLLLLLYSVLKIGSRVLLQHTKALGANPLTQRQLTLRARGKQTDVYTNGVMYKQNREATEKKKLRDICTIRTRKPTYLHNNLLFNFFPVCYLVIVFSSFAIL